MARKARSKISGRFSALPHFVMRSAEFARLSGPAVKLLLLITMKYDGHNNGGLVCTATYLRPLGWRSAKMTVKCVRELMDSGLLIQTRTGMRQNIAARYAIAWLPLDVTDGIELTPAQYLQRRFVGTPIVALVPHGGAANAAIAPHVGNSDLGDCSLRGEQSGEFPRVRCSPMGKPYRSCHLPEEISHDER